MDMTLGVYTIEIGHLHRDPTRYYSGPLAAAQMRGLAEGHVSRGDHGSSEGSG